MTRYKNINGMLLMRRSGYEMGRVHVYFEDKDGSRSDFGDDSWWPNIREAICDLREQDEIECDEAEVDKAEDEFYRLGRTKIGSAVFLID